MRPVTASRDVETPTARRDECRALTRFGDGLGIVARCHLRTYQAYLLKQRKLAAGSVVNHVAALCASSEVVPNLRASSCKRLRHPCFDS